LYALQFADDQVVLAGDKEDLEYMTRKLKESYEKWVLDMNLNKTKYLCTGKRTAI
jgi:malonyl CoA-acyl carrier protein transacylase